MTARGEAAPVEARAERAPRPERGERGERGEGDRQRGPRGERRPAPVSEAGADEATTAQPFVDTVPVGEAAEAAAQGERTGRRRRRGRGGRDRDEAQREIEGNEAEMPVTGATAEDAVATEQATAVEGQGPLAEGETEERDGRRRRGRGDRPRRERREEGAAASTTEAGLVDSDVLAAVTEGVAAAPLPQAEPASVVAAEAAEAAVPLAAAPAPAPVTAPVTVEPFVLPESDLSAIAQNAGLEWVNSDAEKIRAVQEAMAREPKPIHVPRERKPVVRVDEGPLVLVETRKDLSQITLPFDTPAQTGQPAAH